MSNVKNGMAAVYDRCLSTYDKEEKQKKMYVPVFVCVCVKESRLRPRKQNTM